MKKEKLNMCSDEKDALLTTRKYSSVPVGLWEIPKQKKASLQYAFASISQSKNSSEEFFVSLGDVSPKETTS